MTSLAQTFSGPLTSLVPPPGPEELRGRKSLFEVIQWQALPEASEQRPAQVGDAWLDARGRRRVPMCGGGTTAL